MARYCPCPNPPGGHIVCEDDQFGMCAFVNGRQVGGCLSLPATLAVIANYDERNVSTVNWILSTLTGIGRSWTAPVSSAEVKLLSSGSYTNKSGQTVHFSLPAGLDLKVVERTTDMS